MNAINMFIDFMLAVTFAPLFAVGIWYGLLEFCAWSQTYAATTASAAAGASATVNNKQPQPSAAGSAMARRQAATKKNAGKTRK